MIEAKLISPGAKNWCVWDVLDLGFGHLVLSIWIPPTRSFPKWPRQFSCYRREFGRNDENFKLSDKEANIIAILYLFQ